MTKNPSIEIFLDIPSPRYPSGPFLTVAKNRNTIYFDGDSSALIRQRGFTHFHLAVDWSRPKALIRFASPGSPGAVKIAPAASKKGNKGTFQAGRCTKFFTHYGVKLGEKLHFTMEWNEALSAYEFDIPNLADYARK